MLLTQPTISYNSDRIYLDRAWDCLQGQNKQINEKETSLRVRRAYWKVIPVCSQSNRARAQSKTMYFETVWSGRLSKNTWFLTWAKHVLLHPFDLKVEDVEEGTQISNRRDIFTAYPVGSGSSNGVLEPRSTTIIKGISSRIGILGKHSHHLKRAVNLIQGESCKHLAV